MRLTIVDKLVITGILAALATKLLVTPAPAHEWYDPECCSDRDCAPVEKIEQVPEGMRITTRFGTVVAPAEFKRRQSQDGSWHACIVNWGNGPTLRCLYEPSGS